MWMWGYYETRINYYLLRCYHCFNEKVEYLCIYSGNVCNYSFAYGMHYTRQSIVRPKLLVTCIKLAAVVGTVQL